jgi:hypothetical protein
MEEAMRDLRTLGPWLRRFLADYIVIERHLAANTQKSYRDSFKLLLPFISTKATANNERVGWIATRCKPGGADSGMSRCGLSSPYGRWIIDSRTVYGG